jgi:predicted dehydrogenase
MSKTPLNIGMIGCGFMGRTHTNAYRKVNNFFDRKYQPVLKAACARNEDNAKAFAETWGYESIETDWRKLLERDDIDAVDICTPNHMHHDIAIAAAQAGKIILCEKPLAMNVEQGQEMVDAVEKAGVRNTVWYNYRRVPAITLAKQLVDEGRLGRIFHYRSNFLQDFTISEDLPQGGTALWRLDKNVAGSGVTGDLLAHNVDTAMWLNGAISQLSAMTETFVKQRVHQETGQTEPVNIDDAAALMARFDNGALGLFEATRYARGNKALFTFEINGEDASIWWDLQDMHRLKFFDHNDDSKVRGWHDIHVSDGDQPYMSHWWIPGVQIGYEHTFIHHVADFLEAMENNQTMHPDFRDALETQKVCDAILESGQQGQWQQTNVKWADG